MQRVVLRLLLAPGDSVRERSLIDAVAAQSVESDSGLVRSLQIVRRCVTASDALAGLQTGQADVALLGTDLHGLSADVLRAITQSGVPLVVIGTAADEVARGRDRRHLVLLPLDAKPQDVLKALIAAYLGQASLEPPAVVAAISDDVGQSDLRPGAISTLIQAERASASGGIVLAVTSPRGSHGATTVSINLAAALGRTSPTVLLDADLVEPSVAAALNLNPARNMYMVSLDEPGMDPGRWGVALESELQRLTAEGTTKAAVLCGVPKPGLRSELSPAFLSMLLSQLRQHYRYIVVDVGSTTDDANGVSAGHWALISAADRVLVVATPDIVGLRRTAAVVETLRRERQQDANRLALVVNRHRSRHHYSAAEIAKALHVSVAAVIPEDGNAFQVSLCEQRPLVGAGRGRRGSAVRAFSDLAHLVEEAHRDQSNHGVTLLTVAGGAVQHDKHEPRTGWLHAMHWPLWHAGRPKPALSNTRAGTQTPAFRSRPRRESSGVSAMGDIG